MIRLWPKLADSPSLPIRLNITTLCGTDIVIGSSWMAKMRVVLRLDTMNVALPMPSPLPTMPKPLPETRLRGTVKNPCTYPNNIPVASRTRTKETMHTLDQAIAAEQIRKDTIRATMPQQTAEIELPSPMVGESIPQPSEVSDLYSADPQFEEHLGSLEYKKETTELLATVPRHCHDFLDIFRQKAGTHSLPPHRKYDMKIQLDSSANLSAAKLYQLTEDQRQVLLDTLQREVGAGRIRPSNAPYGSPMFFVPKKDGRWRMVVDYRKLNQATIADAYPLPLINQITNDLRSSKFFTKLDLVGAYQLLRMEEGHEHLTAFRTQYGMFESLVVRDGLRNAPAVFQHFLNDVFRSVLGRGVIIYIDDILIHATTLEELRRLTREVFEIVRSSSLYLKASKCEFERTSITFLGYIVSNNGVEADPEKVAAIQEFPRPTNLRESRSFIGLTSYYRRFVPNFANIAGPITALTRKDVAFVWAEPQESAFKELKRRMTEAPVLLHFDPTRETIIQTDASHFGWGFIISQIVGETGLEHPIAIESGRFTGPEINYTTTEKEFMAIVEAFSRCRHMLLQVTSTVVTDHLNLTYWMEPRQLNPRQARWVELLSPFKFKIVYRPGKYATMPDALSRRSDYHPGKGSTVDIDFNFVQALPSMATANTHSPTDASTLRALQRTSRVDREYFVRDVDIMEGLGKDIDIEEVRGSLMAVICAKCDHPTCKSRGLELATVAELRRLSRNPHITTAKWNNRQFLVFNDRVYLPNINDSRLKILKARHDSTLAGHPGINKTIELISRDYIWIGLRKDVELYVNGCVVCQRTKTSHAPPFGLLKTLEVPSTPWAEISMDFVEELPTSNGYNSILVVVDRLTKWAIYIPTHTTLNSAGLGELLLDKVFSQHGLPTHITSDRGSKFVSKLWRYLMSKLGINLRLSTAYHPQTDGQTERVNQVMKQYLRIFTSYNQDDWSSILAQASFAYNNTVHSATKFSPFYSNFGYHP
jgi:hypothetical protein